MGGGVAMRVVGKIAGVVNGSFRGRFPAVPKTITSAAFKANTARPITGVISDTQYDAASSTVNQPLPRLVFGGAPTLEEAQDAIFQLTTAHDQAYLSNESSEGSCESDMGHAKLALSDSGCLESETCVTKASAPNQAFQAFRLLTENAAVQNVVASIATDPNVYNAIMNNETLLEFFQSQKTGMNCSLEEIIAKTEIPGYQSSNYYDDEKEPKNGFNSFFEDIKSRAEDMMNRLSSFFQNLFAGPAAGDGSAQVEKTIGASVIGLALMVIMLVVFKRV